MACRLSLRSAPVAANCCEYVPTPDWTGVYIGIHGGAAWSKSGWTFPFVGNFNPVAGQNFPISADGTLLGGHLGINYQIWRFVLGAEASYTFGGLSDTATGPIGGFPADRFKVDAKDLFTLTGRLGVAHDKFLLYGKAGFASSLVDVSALSSTGVIADTGQRENGWIVGGGLDTRLFSDILFGLEYNYVNLPSSRFTTVTTGAPPSLPFNADIHDMHTQTFVARLSILLVPTHAATKDYSEVLTRVQIGLWPSSTANKANHRHYRRPSVRQVPRYWFAACIAGAAPSFASYRDDTRSARRLR